MNVNAASYRIQNTWLLARLNPVWEADPGKQVKIRARLFPLVSALFYLISSHIWNDSVVCSNISNILLNLLLKLKRKCMLAQVLVHWYESCWSRAWACVMCCGQSWIDFMFFTSVAFMYHRIVLGLACLSLSHRIMMLSSEKVTLNVQSVDSTSFFSICEKWVKSRLTAR